MSTFTASGGTGSGGRHRAPEPDDQEQTWDPWAAAKDETPAPVSPTVVIPAVGGSGDADRTAVIAKPVLELPGVTRPGASAAEAVAPAGPAATSLMGIVPPAPEPSADDDRPPPAPRPGERVIPLRAVRTRSGPYQSIHSALTRTTVGTVIRTGVRTLGEVLIALGVIVLMLAAYEVWGKAAVVASHQDDLSEQLDRQWAQAPQPSADGEEPAEEQPAEPLGPPPGNAIARLYAPSIGKYWVVVEGVGLDDIRFAPGHYPDTAMPGQAGNFSVAGHRNPATFWDLDKVRPGDRIVVETQDSWYVYRVDQNHIVKPDAVEVIAPVPGELGSEPSDPFLTLTTCNPKWDNYERLVVHAKLDYEMPRSTDGTRPPELGGLGS
jgi:sortase A